MLIKGLVTLALALFLSGGKPPPPPVMKPSHPPIPVQTPAEAKRQIRTMVRILGDSLVRARGASVAELIDAMHFMDQANLPFKYRVVGGKVEQEARKAVTKAVKREGQHYTRFRVVHVSYSSSGGVALCLVRFKEILIRFRLRIARQDRYGPWRVYDLEVLGLWASDLVSWLVDLDEQGQDLEQLEPVGKAFEKGWLAVQRGDHAAAVELFEQARQLRQDPSRRQLGGPNQLQHLELLEARSLLELGRAKDALVILEMVLMLEPRLAPMHFLRARAFAQLEGWEDCAAALTPYLEMVGDDPIALHLLGRAQEATDQVDKALASYRRGAAADPLDVDNNEALGVLVLLRGLPTQQAEAEQRLARACSNAPNPEAKRRELAARLENLGFANVAKAIQTPKDPG